MAEQEHGCRYKSDQRFRERHWLASEDRFEGNRAPDLDRHPPISRSPIGVFLIEGAKRRMAMFPRLSISAMRGLSPRFVSKILLTYNSFPPNILNTSIHARDWFNQSSWNVRLCFKKTCNKEYNFLYQLLIFFLRIILSYYALRSMVKNLYKL